MGGGRHAAGTWAGRKPPGFSSPPLFSRLTINSSASSRLRGLLSFFLSLFPPSRSREQLLVSTSLLLVDFRPIL